MSEVTTGSVAVSLIGAPIAVGAACIGAVGYAAKYCSEKCQDMLEDIQETDDRLKWLNQQQCSSPEQVAREVKKLQFMLMKNDQFERMTSGLSISEKNVLATAIVTENSPLKPHLPKYLKEMESGNAGLDEVLEKCKMDLAISNFNYLNEVLYDTANAMGFKAETKVIRQTNKLLDIVFSDEEGKKFTVYNRLNNDLNPSLALDLEGFGCNSNECSRKMDEIIAYLNEKGIPFQCKRLKHNQPAGILRKMITQKRKKKKNNNSSIDDYLNQKNNSPITNQKIK